MLRDLQTGSTTPLCRFRVITGPCSFLYQSVVAALPSSLAPDVISLVPLALHTQPERFRRTKHHLLCHMNADNSHCQIG
jgi:hypothetical protein